MHYKCYETGYHHMSSRHLCLRIDSETLDLLRARSRQAGQTLSHLAKTLLEEGLRMETHPGIIFRWGRRQHGLILTSNRRFPCHDARTIGRLVTVLDQMLTSGAEVANLEYWLS